MRVVGVLRSIRNLHQSIRNRIPHLPSAAEHFLSPSELRDRKFTIFRFQNVLEHEGTKEGPKNKKMLVQKKMKISYLGAQMDSKNVLQH